jgi:signal transduction histidine kinase
MSERLSDRALRGGAWAACLFMIGVFVGVAVVESLDTVVVRDWTDTALGGTVLVLTLFTFPVVGLLVVRQQPRNLIGWLLLASGVMWGVLGFQELYARLAINLWPGHLPAGAAVVAVGTSFWWPAIVTLAVFTVLFFPDGRLPSPRWRWFAWASLVACLLGTLVLVVSPGRVGDTVVIEHNPLGLPVSERAAQLLQASVIWTLPASMLVAASSLVLRFRRSSGVERLQLKWLMAAVVFIAAAFATAPTLSLVGVGADPDSAVADWLKVLQGAALLSFGLVPVTIGIAITRHGLYGIDKLISRTLVVGVLGLFITGVYVVVVVGLGSLIGQRHPSVLLSVVATACVAVLFQPIRERVTRGVNRLVYGSRATPYEVLSDFAASMAGTYTTAELLPRIAQTLSEFLGGARVQVWLRTGRLLEREAAWPDDGGRPEPVVLSEPAQVTGLDAARVVPVRHLDELLGAITVSKAQGEPVTPTEDEMLQHVASQTGLVLRNLRLVDDLHSSRQRLVTAEDDQRRALERDLHDGAQQRLVAIALTLRMATRQRDLSALSAAAAESADQLQGAIAELRELARGLHPAILTDRGLGPALTSLAERCPVPVRLDNQVARRLPGQVEGALYFVAAESLTNIAKHARASEVTLRLTDDGDSVSLEVRDDGVGGADPTRGSGLLGLADRVAVVDGEFTVHSPVGEGTTTICVVPVPSAIPPQRTASSPVAATTGRSR